jgi:energy-coupling factor transporter ATP-binding protein EcfA2
MYIQTVQSNLKMGVHVTLGRFTLLLGRNGAGKSSVVQAIQLAADGLVRDGEGRDELKTAAALARFFPAAEKNVYATATLDDGLTALHWEAKRSKSGSIKVATPGRPVTVVFPVQEVQAVLASDDKKVRAWLSKNVLPAVTQKLVESTLPADQAALIVRLVKQKNLEWDWSVISAAAKAEATLLRRDATVRLTKIRRSGRCAARPCEVRLRVRDGR